MEPDSIDFPLYYNVSPFYPLLVALGALGGLAGMSVYFYNAYQPKIIRVWLRWFTLIQQADFSLKLSTNGIKSLSVNSKGILFSIQYVAIITPAVFLIVIPFFLSFLKLAPRCFEWNLSRFRAERKIKSTRNVEEPKSFGHLTDVIPGHISELFNFLTIFSAYSFICINGDQWGQAE